jgi:hypothetical protein
MKSMSKWVSMLTVGMLLAAAPAFAGDDKADPKAAKPAIKPQPPKDMPDEPPVVAAPDGAAAEIKAGTGVNKKKREVVGEAETFTAGSKVWAWSSVTGAKGETVKHVWKRDDKVLWEKTFVAKSSRYRTWTTHRVKAGSYTVEVQTEDGAVLGTMSFTVS